jgi:mRNA interferase MazF
MPERGDVVLCVLSGDFGKPRPAVVVQSNLFNPSHASITVCPLTTHLVDAPLFRLSISPSQTNGLHADSQIMVDKLTSIKAEKVREAVGKLTKTQIARLDEAMKLWLALE